MYTGDLEWLRSQEEYLEGISRQLSECIDEKGKDTVTEGRFLDWPSSDRPDVVDAGVQAIHLLAADSLRRDSLAADSLSLDSLGLTPADSLDSLARDTIYRLVKGFRNVRIYRSDFQSVCDSLVAVSRDSTIHLYIDPVLWNQNSQITSDVMDIFTANSQIVRAEFVGRPLMVSELDTMHYNQVAGKTMTAPVSYTHLTLPTTSRV